MEPPYPSTLIFLPGAVTWFIQEICQWRLNWNDREEPGSRSSALYPSCTIASETLIGNQDKDNHLASSMHPVDNES
jgi:hypothetical protein